MPLVQVKLSKEAFTPTEKREIVTELTDAMVSIKEQNSPSWVDIEDVFSDEWEIGGLAMTTERSAHLLQANKKTSEGI
jgi:4-oxalocrotonate tautomerase